MRLYVARPEIAADWETAHIVREVGHQECALVSFANRAVIAPGIAVGC